MPAGCQLAASTVAARLFATEPALRILVALPGFILRAFSLVSSIINELAGMATALIYGEARRFERRTREGPSYLAWNDEFPGCPIETETPSPLSWHSCVARYRHRKPTLAIETRVPDNAHGHPLLMISPLTHQLAVTSGMDSQLQVYAGDVWPEVVCDDSPEQLVDCRRFLQS